MNSWFKKKVQASPEISEAVVTQPPNERFVWPTDVTFTAVDEVVIALPEALFAGRKIGECVIGPNDMEIGWTPGKDYILVKLQPGMSATIIKSCEAFLIADDQKPRRLKIRGKLRKPPTP